MGAIDTGYFVTIVVALIGSIGTIWGIVSTRRSRETEIAGSWQDMVTKEQDRSKRLSDRLDKVETRLDAAEKQIERLMEGVSILSNQIVEMGEDPDWRYENGE
jgi:uncharacterized protein HemX